MKQKEYSKLLDIREKFADLIRRYDSSHTLDLIEARALLIEIDMLLEVKSK